MNKKQNNRRHFIKTAALAGIASGMFQHSSSILKAEDRLTLPASKDNDGLVFLFQGDSITDGKRGRNNDPNHIMGHGYAFSIASRIGADFPHNNFQFFNRGISGNKVTDLQTRWEKDTLNLKPDVLSILVGINDVNQCIDDPAKAQNIEAFEMSYRDLLDQAKQRRSETLFVLGLPFVYPVGKRKSNFDHWQKHVKERENIIRKLAEEFNAVLVDYPAVFNGAMKNTPASYWIWDGIHPTVFGHELMAREWIKQVSKRLSFLKFYND